MNIKNPRTLVRLGLALIFLANSLTAFFAPQEFRDLVESSFLSHILSVIPSATLVVLIGINDALVALLLILNVKQLKSVAIWACIWLVGVMAVVGEPLDVLEHLGIFLVAASLIFI